MSLGFENYMIKLRYEYEKHNGLIENLDFNFITTFLLPHFYVSLTQYLTVQFENLYKIFRIKYNYVWFNILSLSQKNEIIKNIYEINTFIHYASRILNLPYNIDIQTYKEQLNINFRKYQKLIDYMLSPGAFNFEQEVSFW